MHIYHLQNAYTYMHIHILGGCMVRRTTVSESAPTLFVVAPSPASSTTISASSA